MGASFAYALRGFRDAALVGVDADEGVCREAEQKGAVDKAYLKIEDAARGTNVLMFCVYPSHIPSLLKRCAGLLPPGAVLTDICGVKSRLYEELTPLLPPHAHYVGIHPMAGKERDGFGNADPAIFHNSGFIICPHPATRPEDIALMRELAAYIGAGRIAVTDYEKHDEIISYTSDLMHISAAGLCLNFHPEMSLAHTAGAYRDCTRIADINADAWTELLRANSANVLNTLDAHIGGLTAIRAAIAGEDKEALRALLDQAGRNKRDMLAR
jgi:prephenate dehydrogenase